MARTPIYTTRMDQKYRQLLRELADRHNLSASAIIRLALDRLHEQDAGVSAIADTEHPDGGAA